MEKNLYAISRQIPHSHVIMEILWQSPDTSSFEKYWHKISENMEAVIYEYVFRSFEPWQLSLYK